MNAHREKIEKAVRHAQKTLTMWGLKVDLVVQEESVGHNIFIAVKDDRRGFEATFATVSPHGRMCIDLTPRAHASTSITSLPPETLSLMFALSALSNLMSHKTGWLQLEDDTYLSLSWDYYQEDKNNSFDVDVMVAKPPATQTPAEPMEMEVKVNSNKNLATVDGAIRGTGDINTIMRTVVRLVLAFVDQDVLDG